MFGTDKSSAELSPTRVKRAMLQSASQIWDESSVKARANNGDSYVIVDAIQWLPKSKQIPTSRAARSQRPPSEAHNIL